MPRLDDRVYGTFTGAFGRPAGPEPQISSPTAGMVATPCLNARGGHLAVPRLVGVSTKYQIAFGIEPAARLGHTLLEAGIADCDDWRQSGRNPLEFLDKTLRRWAVTHGADEIATEFALSLALVSDLDPYGQEDSAARVIEDMYLAVEPESAGYVVLAPRFGGWKRSTRGCPTSMGRRLIAFGNGGR